MATRMKKLLGEITGKPVGFSGERIANMVLEHPAVSALVLRQNLMRQWLDRVPA